MLVFYASDAATRARRASAQVGLSPQERGAVGFVSRKTEDDALRGSFSGDRTLAAASQFNVRIVFRGDRLCPIPSQQSSRDWIDPSQVKIALWEGNLDARLREQAHDFEGNLALHLHNVALLHHPELKLEVQRAVA